ncbi:hypothetical protein A2303_00480 [Candidatus Falkowbacteria bacterium RIFOXYB2_FULL_47_14]|uniref:Orotidine 5'-phosphate decarboxylase domain-containing protein n=1 Tax=Candidatus Falkowbacteria bacterium RIFOXYA2_FULL_47_19 TaxID=1797994 RepID=A0A1F5SN94_9BACT|nr:MAG: hypothetical protein A2227_03885 [Candidatus Falkowbacteria bacterium RIFOXYA2_FULL_47_19]OGF34694.1 MAG: hypothetical protein A2468_02430 [Candidatus Falkowbacteria bacterium RIFOXYC2_FULL_46_15]OGF42852.1 MAG: hypothetical protein A2303_00480 [Candidatus Falkowbacteria bacterium RIFOXYB2_FULL_47_14]
MLQKHQSKLDPKKKYLQVALNSTLEEAHRIINQLPQSDRIIVEAGTPLIKRYGEEGIRKIGEWWSARLNGLPAMPQIYTKTGGLLGLIINQAVKQNRTKKAGRTDARGIIEPYVVADLKMIDRGEAEVEIAYRGGASAAVAMGSAPAEALNAFIAACEARGLDPMIDMMNVDYPLAVLRKLKKQPPIVILHRGVDEEKGNKQKMLPLHEIRRVKGNYDMMIAVAGGDTIREVESAIFNDADIVVVWKKFYESADNTASLAEEFLAGIK